MPLVLKPKKRISEIDNAVVDGLKEQLNCSRLLALILYNRGFTEAAQCQSFLHPDKSLTHDPFDMLNMQAVVARLTDIKNQSKRVTVYGDYDVDGISATAILINALKIFGIDADYYIPDRHTEGYGLNESALDKIFAAGTDLVLTVDCGIASASLIKKQNELGREMIVTDHHTIIDQVPDCLVLKPGQPGDNYGYTELCGAGIAFKLAKALIGEKADQFIDYACVATVADVVPLTGENRYIVKTGLERLNASPRRCYKALLEAAEFTGTVNEDTVGFIIAPRLNAAGRMENAVEALKLLLCEDDTASFLAEQLCKYNVKRQETERTILESALAQIKTDAHIRQYKVLVLAGQGWDEGVIGICAARLAEKYRRPTILFSINENGIAKGSGRSVEGIDLFEMLQAASDILIQFGGHKMAAGMSVSVDNLQPLRERLSNVLEAYYDQKLLFPAVEYDAKATVEDITEDFCRSIDLLRPCGCANPMVTLRIDNCSIGGIKKIGALKNHLRLYIQDTHKINGVAFNYEMHNGDFFNFQGGTVIVRPELNSWQGVESASVKIVDIKESEYVKPRMQAEVLTAMFYSRLNIPKSGKAQINFIDDNEELSYLISEWENDDISGTLILCDHPEYAAGCVKVIMDEAPRFDVSLFKPINTECGYNACVFGLDIENFDFSAYKRVVFYDLLNTGYADRIIEKAPWLQLYALKCGTELFDTVFDEYKNIDRDALMPAYKAISLGEGTYVNKLEFLRSISEARHISMPVTVVALEVFRELGFIECTDGIEFTVKMRHDAEKRKLEESNFYQKITKVISRNGK